MRRLDQSDRKFPTKATSSSRCGHLSSFRWRRWAGLSVDRHVTPWQSCTAPVHSIRYDGFQLQRRFYRSNILMINYNIKSNMYLLFKKVRDGAGESASLIGRYCGSVPPPSLIGSANVMWLRQVTGTSGRRANFVASLSFQESMFIVV